MGGGGVGRYLCKAEGKTPEGESDVLRGVVKFLKNLPVFSRIGGRQDLKIINNIGET